MSLRLSLLTWVQPVLVAVAWLLLLLVSITPIPESIYFLRIAADVSASFLKSGVSGSVRLGVWGYCTTGLDVSVLGTSHDSAGGCSPRHLGYQIDPSLAKALHVNDLTDAISETLSAALALHVIGCVLVFLALCIFLIPVVLECVGRGFGVVSDARLSLAYVAVTSLALFITLLAFIFDIAFVSVARSKINKAADGALHVSGGSATWLTLTATILIAIVLIMAVVRHRSKNFKGLRRGPPDDEKRYLGFSNTHPSY
ncbi:actin cortical patch SUR7/pH-response regulator pali [Dichomitus squalens]|uniref:Actin cortical patch SUR7/pH-response regulator pali n=1 Tax=Dichomitus squalens TaxID=114155 RepID=A0A4V2K298_9APHY|nr:actin cortical patch SUR7/pH-response regulator pali [Dichomitus squalens]